jgi:hypothetical protein
MKTINMPGFSADASLSDGQYRRAARRQEAMGERRGEPQGTVVVPQLGGPGFKGLAGCLMDCQDSHPTWTAARCRAACHASEVGAGGGTLDPTNRALSVGGCWTWWAACKVNPFGFFCDTVRDRCLADIPR